MIKNIFITGLPGSGKTTLIKEIVEELNLAAGGFYTSEIRERGQRKGFKIITLDGKEGILAHTNIKSPYRVSKYKINIRDLEKIGVESILKKENKICLIDEVGLMELYSKKFRKAVLAVLNSHNMVLGTIMLKSNPFCDKIKERKDTKVFYLTKENFQKLKREIKKFFYDNF